MTESESRLNWVAILYIHTRILYRKTLPTNITSICPKLRRPSHKNRAVKWSEVERNMITNDALGTKNVIRLWKFVTDITPARVSWDEKCTREKYGKSNLLGRDLEVNKKEKRGLIYIWGKNSKLPSMKKEKSVVWVGIFLFFRFFFLPSLLTTCSLLFSPSKSLTLGYFTW